MSGRRRRSKTRRKRKSSFTIPRKINILYKFIECVNCRNKSLEGLKGLVIEVTKNTLKILTIDNKVRTVIKDECWYYVKLGDKVYLVHWRQLA